MVSSTYRQRKFVVLRSFYAALLCGNICVLSNGNSAAAFSLPTFYMTDPKLPTK